MPGWELGGEPEGSAFTMPEDWWPHVHVRRGGRVVGGAAVEAVEAVPGEVEAVLANPVGDQELVAAARDHLAGVVTPVGAAAVAALAEAGPEVGDAWAHAHGLPFAARAAVEGYGVEVHRDVYGKLPSVLRRTLQNYRVAAGFLRRVRELLAGASEAEHEAAMAAVGPHRVDLRSLVAAAYLFPGNGEWVDGAFDEVERTKAPVFLLKHLRVSLLQSSGTVAQVERALAGGAAQSLQDPEVLRTVVDGVGPAVAPALASVLGPDLESAFRDLLLGTLAEFPTAGAFDALVARLAGKRVRATVLDMARRYPALALERFAAGGAPARPLLESHLKGHLDLADRVELPDDVRALVERMRAERSGIEVAPVSALPAVLAVPRKGPAPGRWAQVNALPPVLLSADGRALPVEAVERLLTLLAAKATTELAAVREVCDAASLARFAWELFELWRADGMPLNDGWVFTALGALGDDGVVRGLTPLIRAWPGEGQHKRAVTGLEVLAAIGTDSALAALDGIARRVKYAGLRKRARERILDVAAGLGLSPERLADRLVPDLGLDDAAVLAVDYGTRRFAVGFDERLRPFVLDEGGRRLKDLPRPGAKDDGEVAPAEHKRFGQLKKDVRAVADDQITRLEQAMVVSRRWPAAEFRTLLVGHPLLRHLVRRLVWVVEDGRPFRVAEDGTVADVRDDAFDLPEDALVGVAHPVGLGDDVKAWADVFADYAILQPFRQLERPVFRLDEAELSSRNLDRFDGVRVEVGRLLGLTAGAWERGAVEGAGIERTMARPLPGGRVVGIVLDPGIVRGAPDEDPVQTLRQVGVLEGTFGDLDPVSASEVLAELTGLRD
ncbi:DUF4132 domain-containing protein [Umezawaea sp. Da 62-37]|uniref:DUF4132 domain-containing protein n=1 Tax=Umezawaea sp. Da 62-37 TaxID=3075927 RepID=UPI0028F70A0D|nr:DUF4132 domain-containing protein [Umezawaea sp. Da 62-37]WNV85793.1 DUF4132 domain-containing protein [Umezawaea sp. Da 62-37]